MIKLETESTDERLYNRLDVAAMLHIKPNTVSRLCDANEIVGGCKTARDWQIPESAIKTFMSDRGIPLNIARQEIYTPADVANIIGVSSRTARDLFDNGSLGGYKLWRNVDKPNQRRHIPQSELIKFIQENDICSEEARALQYSPLPANDRLKSLSLAPALVVSDKVHTPEFEHLGFDRDVEFASGLHSASLKLGGNNYSALLIDMRGADMETLEPSAKAVKRMHNEKPNINFVVIVDDISKRNMFSASGARTLIPEKLDQLPSLIAAPVPQGKASGVAVALKAASSVRQ